jgi:hypothetical protein
MDVLQYYELKQKYQENITRRKNMIKKKENISTKEKRVLIKKIIGKCINCGKSGGTHFEEKNGLLKAVCGNSAPCELNINIKRKLYDNMRTLEQKNDKQSENLKMRIIMTKLDYLFGLVSSKDEIVDKFNTLKNELAQISEIQLIAQKKYGDIISGVHREPLLVDANLDLINEIDELKKIYKEYLAEPLQNYLITMVEKYITTIKPLCEKIRNMTYGYYAVEADIEAGAGPGAGPGAGAAEAGANDENGGDKAKKASTYTLVALPYRLEQIEQERK